MCEEAYMRIVNDLDGPFGRTFSVLGIVKQALIDSGREEEVAEFLSEATSGDYDDLKALAGKYVNIDWTDLSMEDNL